MAYHNPNELFFQPELDESPERETPGPLRINKKPTPVQSPEEEQPVQQWASYRVPPSAYGAPTSPPPTGPLPYPDQQRNRGHPAFRTATPQDSAAQAEEGRGGGPSSWAQRQSISSDASSGHSGGAGARRARFDANDPNRPTAGGYGQSPTLPQASRIAERRGTPAKTLSPVFPDSPGGPEPPHKSPDPPLSAGEEGTLFAIPPVRPPPIKAATTAGPTDAELHQQYYPPPLGGTPQQPPIQPSASSSAVPTLHAPVASKAGVNRLDSTASTSTTKASRGSPPPPETPAIDTMPTNGLTGIEARYAASGIAGTNTLNEMQAQSAAAAARRAHYANLPTIQSAAPSLQPQHSAGSATGSGSGRWSPTERPGTAPHGPPILFQGNEEVQSVGGGVPSQAASRRDSGSDASSSSRRRRGGERSEHPLEADMARMNVHDEPPPAYSPPAAGTAHSQYPNEKGRYASQQQQQQRGQAGAMGDPKGSGQDPNIQRHPAFANDPRNDNNNGTPVAGPSTQPQLQQQNSGGSQFSMAGANGQQHPGQTISPQHSGGAGPSTSPPPLPEGWIAHLDNSSGQYYYIHLPTQSTQWEFPKGPTPLNLQEPMSPVGTFYNNPLASPVGSIFKQPIASPGFGPVPQSAGFDGRTSMMSAIASPTAAGFSGPPPSAGVDMYRIAPTNGVYFGPYLRYTNVDLERGLWLGSVMLVTDAQQPPTIHIHQSLDLSPNPRQLKAHPIHSHQRWIFYRYDIDLMMDDNGPAKWTYAITSHLGCTRYEFLVAGRNETSWRFIAHSGNDFSPSVSANERSRLGGVPLVWKDVLVKHQECGGFHTQIGLGGQICADRLWKDIPALKQWLQMSGKDNRKNAQFTPKLDEDVTHAFFHYYTSHFDQPAVREAFAQIPHICCLDDGDIFEGYGSFPDNMQNSHMFRNISRIGIEMYLLFQHHTTPEILRNVSNDIDLFTITGTGWHFIKYLGPAVVLVGPDTRSERSAQQVLAGPTYQGIFPKVAVLPPSVQHCIWLFPVPIVFPRMDNVEQVFNTVATSKKFVTGAFNVAGKVSGGLASVVGGKGVVNSGFEGVKRAVGKTGLMQNVLSPFGEVELLDELRDMWTHESKDLERTYIIRTLQGISHKRSIRMTFLSGSVNLCGAGLVHDPAHPTDHKTMYQLITSSIVNAPQHSYINKFLHNNRTLYVPQNGHRSSAGTTSDTKEDMMEIFAADVDGRPRELRRLMARRNYLACVAFDPELVGGGGGGGGAGGGGFGAHLGSREEKSPNHPDAGRLSLAADFMVQGEGAFAQPMKYGPVVIPGLEYGR